MPEADALTAQGFKVLARYEVESHQRERVKNPSKKRFAVINKPFFLNLSC